MPAISSTDNVIDSRDVEERIGELEDMEAEGEIDNEEQDELDALLELREQARSYRPDWDHGEALILEDYFPEYVEEMVKDIGAIPSNTPGWIVIDWEATAENVKQDYIEVDFDGSTYLIRA